MDAKCLHILRSKAILKNISISEQQQFSPTGYMLSCGTRTLFFIKNLKNSKGNHQLHSQKLQSR